MVFETKSQRSLCLALYHSNFHRLLLFDRRDVLYACIAFCTKRIDVYPILSPDHKFGESLAHALILFICFATGIIRSYLLVLANIVKKLELTSK